MEDKFNSKPMEDAELYFVLFSAIFSCDFISA